MSELISSAHSELLRRRERLMYDLMLSESYPAAYDDDRRAELRAVEKALKENE